VPGVDFDRVRTEITMERVLSLLRLQPSTRSSVQWCGSCPLHESTSRSARSGLVNVAIGRYFCHGLESHGRQLDLWPQPGSRPCIKLRSTCAVGLAAMFPGYSCVDEPSVVAPRASTACRHHAPGKREEATGTSSVRQKDYRLS
jgi:hypothetical protein